MRLRAHFKKVAAAGLTALSCAGAPGQVPLAQASSAPVARQSAAAQDHIKSHPARLAAFASARMRHWRSARTVVLSGGKSMAALEMEYPVLQGLFDETRAWQKRLGGTLDMSAAPLTAEVDVPEAGARLLFVSLQGPFFCGAQYCETHVYADTGAGWKNALDVLTGDDVYVSAAKGRVSLFAAPYSEDGPAAVEWILRGDVFVENASPQEDPRSTASPAARGENRRSVNVPGSALPSSSKGNGARTSS